MASECAPWCAMKPYMNPNRATVLSGSGDRLIFFWSCGCLGCMVSCARRVSRIKIEAVTKGIYEAENERVTCAHRATGTIKFSSAAAQVTKRRLLAQKSKR